MTQPRETSPLQDASEELLAEIVPVVVERMRSVSRRLEECSRKLTKDADGVARGGRGFGELERVQEESEQLGWLMGVLASASGEDLLLARRERYGVALLVDLVGEVLGEEGRALDPLPTELPDLAPQLTDGWRLPWGVGLLFRLAAHSLPDGAPVRWEIALRGNRAQLRFPEADPDGTAPLLVDLEGLLPGTEAHVDGAGFGMDIPANWFATAPA